MWFHCSCAGAAAARDPSVVRSLFAPAGRRGDCRPRARVRGDVRTRIPRSSRHAPRAPVEALVLVRGAHSPAALVEYTEHEHSALVINFSDVLLSPLRLPVKLVSSLSVA